MALFRSSSTMCLGTEMHLTRQDHIDRQIRAVGPCMAHRMHRSGEVVVIFANDEWVCSSGHVSEYDNLPGLRTPERDPLEWVKENAFKLAQALPVAPCSAHSAHYSEIAYEADWGLAGHLYVTGHERKLTLCLPLAELGAS